MDLIYMLSEISTADAFDIGLLSIDSLLWFVLVTRFHFFPKRGKIFWQFLKFHITAFGQKIICFAQCRVHLASSFFSTALCQSSVRLRDNVNLHRRTIVGSWSAFWSFGGNSSAEVKMWPTGTQLLVKPAWKLKLLVVFDVCSQCG